MAKPRNGFDVYFPAKEYVDALRFLSNREEGKGTYTELQQATKVKKNLFGVKVKRIAEHGLIELVSDKKRGLYRITESGRRVLKAYDAYVAALK